MEQLFPSSCVQNILLSYIEANKLVLVLYMAKSSKASELAMPISSRNASTRYQYVYVYEIHVHFVVGGVLKNLRGP